MKNIINYVKNYGSKSFDEVGLNDIDFLVFSSLSYVPFNNIFLDSAKYSLGQLHKIFFSNTSDKENKNNINFYSIIYISKYIIIYFYIIF